MRLDLIVQRSCGIIGAGRMRCGQYKLVTDAPDSIRVFQFNRISKTRF